MLEDPPLSSCSKYRESPRLKLRLLLFHCRTSPWISSWFSFTFSSPCENKKWASSKITMALVLGGKLYGSWVISLVVANYNHTLKFLPGYFCTWWFVLTQQICWCFSNPFWGPKVFLFFVCFLSSFLYGQIYCSLGFCLALH